LALSSATEAKFSDEFRKFCFSQVLLLGFPKGKAWRAVLRRRKKIGFHPEIWMFSSIFVILRNYKNATEQPNFRMKSGFFPSPQYDPKLG
jgi:hypothetical protein